MDRLELAKDLYTAFLENIHNKKDLLSAEDFFKNLELTEMAEGWLRAADKAIEKLSK